MEWLFRALFMAGFWILGIGLLEGDFWQPATYIGGAFIGISIATVQMWDTRVERWLDRLEDFGEGFRSPRKRTLRRVVWVSAFLLAVAGAVLYLVADTSLWWWLAGAASVPFFLLAVSRQWRLEEAEGKSKTPYGGMGDGPWGPP